MDSPTPRFVFLVAILLFPALSNAQTSRVSATLEGAVSDSSGGLIEAATVRIRDTATGLVRVVTTDEQGSFRAGELPVGTYAGGAPMHRGAHQQGGLNCARVPHCPAGVLVAQC